MHERLSQLIHGYLSGSLTDAERQELATLLDREEAVEQLSVLMQEQQTDPDVTVYDPLPSTEERIVQGILSRMHAEATAPVRRLRPLRKWAWAAAAVLLLAAGTYRWLANNNSAHPPVTTTGKSHINDIGPGGNKAILTLSDGTSVVLDSMAGGTIARQANAEVVKLANGMLAYHPQGKTSDSAVMNTLRTPRGGQYRLSLPDGTQVWLNAASSITYPTSFSGHVRSVAVSGEAYFEVAPDKEKPFVADVDGRSSIVVLGTRFNVNSYANEGAVRTTLLEGGVKVLGAGGRSEIVLRPGQQAQVNGQQVAVNDHVDIDKIMAWKNGLFNFDNASLAEVMRQVERWYDVQVVYEKGVPDVRFEGAISRDLSLSDLLKVLERAEVKFRVEEGRRLVVVP